MPELLPEEACEDILVRTAEIQHLDSGELYMTVVNWQQQHSSINDVEPSETSFVSLLSQTLSSARSGNTNFSPANKTSQSHPPAVSF